MNRFGRLSLSRLEGVHPLQVEWAYGVLKIIDISVISGVRSLSTQRQYVKVGASKTMKSYHLIQEDGYGHALDLAPYPIDWNKLRGFDILAGVGLTVAYQMGIPITWGGDWNKNLDVYDNSFNDLGHFQIEVPYTPIGRLT